MKRIVEIGGQICRLKRFMCSRVALLRQTRQCRSVLPHQAELKHSASFHSFVPLFTTYCLHAPSTPTTRMNTRRARRNEKENESTKTRASKTRRFVNTSSATIILVKRKQSKK
uniref:Uncharacterized protein n=1 Tax=Trypanosoma congolense (strain IL3000) TaxID=1068625 RepID=G0UUP3_TRYCI|nr:hypothetical protein, unlikely [Trypanosoma congolense IL3000]